MTALLPGTMASCPSSPLLDECDAFCETGEDWALPLMFNADGDVANPREVLRAVAEHLPTHGLATVGDSTASQAVTSAPSLPYLDESAQHASPTHHGPLPDGAEAVLSGSSRTSIRRLACQEPFRLCARIPRLQRLRISSKRPRTPADDRGSHPPAVPAAPLTLQQRQAWAMYQSRPTYALKRATWVSAWRHASASSFPETLSFAQQMKRGCQRFKTLSEEEKQVVFEEALRKGWTPTGAGGQAGNGNSRQDPAHFQALQSSGFMLTWNQPEIQNKRVQMLLKQVQASEPGSAKYEKLMEKVLQEPMFISEWAAFKDFLQQHLPRAGNITEISSCLELSMKAQVPRWHFHTMVSNKHPEVGQDSNLVTLCMHKLRYEGFRPFGSCARGRGSSAVRAVDRMHAYCQWPKVGSVWQETNYRRGIDFGCKANWIMEAWQQRKLTVTTERREIIFNRDRVETCMRQLDQHEELVQ